MTLSLRSMEHERSVRAVRSRYGMVRMVMGVLMCCLGYGALTGTAHTPTIEPSADMHRSEPVAVVSISHVGDQLVIIGSVDHLFAAAGFSGPNRAEKSDRIHPGIDVLALSRSFEAARTQLAALRNASVENDVMGVSSVTAAGASSSDKDLGPRLSVATINPATAAALDAIARIAPPMAAIYDDNATPLPVAASEQLAYARASAPVSEYATGKAVTTTERELWCLANAIYFEARGESYRGQVAVAQVVLNRVKDHRYPDTICGVVYQNQSRRNACQFSFACDGIPDIVNDQRAWGQAQEIARKYTSGELYLIEVGEATHYHATYVRPGWAPRMTRVTQIGLHIFYKFKSGWLFG